MYRILHGFTQHLDEDDGPECLYVCVSMCVYVCECVCEREIWYIRCSITSLKLTVIYSLERRSPCEICDNIIVKQMGLISSTIQIYYPQN